MKRNTQAGESVLEGVIILAVLLIIVITLPKNDQRPGDVPGATLNSASGGTTSYSNNSGGSVQGTQIRTAPQTQRVTISSGNASYAYQPYEEYITIDNIGNNPVNITGWQLRNGKDRRPYNVGGSLQRFSADIALIPQATKILPTFGAAIMQDIILEQGERAIVTTGRLNVEIPYKIVSFKENMCTGYLDAMPEYSFTPSLNRNCPRPLLEPGIENLEPACRDMIATLPSCQVPRFGGQDREGNPCPSCINGQIFSYECRAFIQKRFNYQGCLATHSHKPDFYSRTWRVFLGRSWEMWAKDYETIELFNQHGQLVDFRNY
jgi:hypothetical protein